MITPSDPTTERPRPRKLSPLGRLYIWATHRLYDELAWAYDPVSWLVSAGRWDHWRRLALEYVPSQPVLEVGFGTGELLAEMAGRGWDVTGIELSPAMQRVTAGKLRRRGLQAHRVRGRVQQLPFPDGHFAAILSTFPAEYIVDPAGLAEFGRVLRAGGRLVIAGAWVEVETPLLRILSRLLGGFPSDSYVERVRAGGRLAGLAMTLLLRDDPPARVSIIIGEKLP